MNYFSVIIFRKLSNSIIFLFLNFCYITITFEIILIGLDISEKFSTKIPIPKKRSNNTISENEQLPSNCSTCELVIW